MPRRQTIVDSSDEEVSDNASSDRIPSEERLENGLRDAVRNVFRTGNLEELTVKRVRLATENVLGLQEGFFKGHDTWKARSDRIIKEEAEAQESKRSEKQEDRESPAKTPKRKTNKLAKADSEEVIPSKKKRRKVESDVGSGDDASSMEETGKQPTSSSKATRKQDEIGKTDSGPLADDKSDQSESEMSVVLDEEPKPKPKKRQKTAETAAPKGRKTQPAAKSSDLDPDQAEIKRLQGWLIKCGIRKMWHRELAPYETPKLKIKHLKKMLEDAGMKGRYSLEKARQIRDERELQADLAAVTEGASKWGADKDVGGSASETEENPRRRLVKGRQSLAFLSDDGEETD